MRRWLIALAAIFIIYLVVGFFVLPPIVRGQIEEKVGAALERQVTVEKVRMNPLVFSIAVEGFRVADHDGGELASWKRAYVNFDPLTSLFRWEWHVGDIELIEPKQRLAIDEQGRLNIADLLEGAAAQPPEGTTLEPKSVPALGLGRLHIENWGLSLSDHSRRVPFDTVVGPMTFEVTGLTTEPDQESPYSFSGRTDAGATFGWSGTITAQPPGSEGTIEFTGIPLPKYAPLTSDIQRAEVRSGTFAFSTKYSLSMGETPIIRVADTTVAIEDLGLAFAGVDEPAVRFDKLEILLPSADAVARTASIEKVALSGLNVVAERRADGSIDLLDWLPPEPEAPAEATPAPAEEEVGADTGPAPTVKVARVEIVDARVKITDRTNPRPAVLLLDQIHLAATNGGTDLDREVGIESTLRWNEGGTVAVNGTVRPLPLAAALEVKLEGVELAPLDPFVEPFADVRIQGGVLNVSGHADLAQPSGGKLALTWTGDTSIDGLDTRDGKLGTELAAWKSVAVKDSRATLEPLAFSAAEVAIVEPLVNLAIAKDGTINVMAALGKESPDLENVTKGVQAFAEEAAEEPAAEEASATPAPATSVTEAIESATAEAQEALPFEAKVDLISISGGTVRVHDESVGSGFSTELSEFGGTIKGLSSDNLARADVDLSAKLDRAASLKIVGKINPLAEDKYSDIKVDFSNIQLPRFSPYSGRFIGQKIEKGTLQVDLGYKVSQNVLQGENRVVLDQFYLGEKVQSPDALKLPIGLALALLRDRSGKIDLDVPVRGNLDDPDFKYGQVVWKAIGNIIVKAATSPFKMLGGILGGGARQEDLSYVDFASAVTQPGEQAGRKLDLLKKALFERPALRLEVNAPPSPSGDRDGLLEQRLAELLRAEKARQLNEAAASPGPPPAGDGKTGAKAAAVPPEAQPVPPQEVTVSPAETDGLLRAIFVREFPEEAARAAAPAAEGTSTAAATVAGSGRGQEAAGEQRPGLLRRIWRTLIGSSEDRAAAPAERTAGSEAAGPAGAEASESGAEQVPEPLPIAEVRARVVGTIALAESDFQELAEARRRVIRDSLLEGGQVEPERVILAAAPNVPEGASLPSDGARVFFQLE